SPANVATLSLSRTSSVAELILIGLSRFCENPCSALGGPLGCCACSVVMPKAPATAKPANTTPFGTDMIVMVSNPAPEHEVEPERPKIFAHWVVIDPGRASPRYHRQRGSRIHSPSLPVDWRSTGR